MKIIALSPESDEPREHAVLDALFAAGLERYHVRKPHWPRAQLVAWLDKVPVRWRSRLVLHQQHELVTQYALGGVHYKDGQAILAPRLGCMMSGSCHDLESLGAAMGHFDSVFFSPVFPSISKPGYLPKYSLSAVTERLVRRTAHERKTSVIALGGITPANATRCGEFGFDGVAVLGALWQAIDPMKVFDQLQESLVAHAN